MPFGAMVCCLSKPTPPTAPGTSLGRWERPNDSAPEGHNTGDGKMNSKVYQTRAKAFTGRGVAGHYTTCHSLGKSAQTRIRRLAKAR